MCPCIGFASQSFSLAHINGRFFVLTKLHSVGHGVNKLQVMRPIEVVDVMLEQIQVFGDYVRSVDIAATSKT